MPKLKFKGKQSQEWKPLPDGTYDLMIDSIEQTTSQKGNAQLKVSAHVEGGSHDEKKVTLWFSLVPQAMWKMLDILDATGVDYTADEIDEVDPETGKPLIELEFDSDDLPGAMFTVDAKQSTDNKGRPNNNFSNERPVEGSDAERKLNERLAAEEAEAAEAEAEAEVGGEEAEDAEAEEAEAETPATKAAASKPAAETGGGGSRRRRVRQAAR